MALQAGAAYPCRVPDNIWLAALFSVTPTIIVGLIFWFIVRAILRADRSERTVYERIEAEERAAQAEGAATPGRARDADAADAPAPGAGAPGGASTAAPVDVVDRPRRDG